MSDNNQQVPNNQMPPNGQQKMQEEFTISITFDNNVTVECAIIAIFPVEGRNYIALLPLTPVQGIDPEEVFLYRYSTIGSKDSIKLDTIETDAEYNRVADAFDTLVAEHEKKKSI